jgi:myo-inositol catabolism protein IolC
MAKRLYLLPFDHRETFARKLFGWQGPLNAEQAEQIATAKQLIYDGFQAAVASGIQKEHAAILADERFSAAILRDAARKGYMTACPAEKSGQREFAFEFGDDFARHIETVDPMFCKVLVRYNPEGDAAMNQRQASRLKRLSDYLHHNNRPFMFELLVPPEHAHVETLQRSETYDVDCRPGLMVRAVGELQAAGVEPDVWKVEGMDRREDCERLVAAVRRNGRDNVSCIVLGRGEDGRRVRKWLATAASVPGFIGFAVGRTTFWRPLVDWHAGRIERSVAVSAIARRYREWVDVFEASASSPTETQRLALRALRRWENEGGHL